MKQILFVKLHCTYQLALNVQVFFQMLVLVNEVVKALDASRC
jgi:hypothetical protein